MKWLYIAVVVVVEAALSEEAGAAASGGSIELEQHQRQNKPINIG